MFELVVRNGSIVDGTGRPQHSADIAICEDKIVMIGDLSQASAKRTIDASGMVVCPGFIDMHSHSDLSILSHRKAESSISQGITTEVIGNCGWSPAPCKAETIEYVLDPLIRNLVDKDTFDDFSWEWSSFGEFLDVIEAGGIAVNLVPLVGQSLIRAHVVGVEDRKATLGELEAMQSLLERCLEEGAWGMSTGRSYKPGGFAPTDEIVGLCKVLAKHESIYASHMKDEGEKLIEAVNEVIKIAEATGVIVEISHHKAIGRENFGKVNESLSMIEKARRRGLRITVDVYPYEFSQVSSLARLLPPEVWEEERGCGSSTQENCILKRRIAKPIFAPIDKMKEMLKDSNLSQYIMSYVEAGTALEGLKRCVIINCPSMPDLEGKILGEYADEKGIHLGELVAKLLLSDGLSVHSASSISLKDIHTVMKAPFSSIGTDAFAVDRQLVDVPIHPRHFGSFPRVVGRFVRDDCVFSLEEAVRKCTGFPARVLGLCERGLIEIGYSADIVIFDPFNFADVATGKEPYRQSAGLEYVVINGKVAFEKGQHVNVFSGKVLRH